MLRIYAVVLDWLEAVAPVVATIEGRDRNLADQLRRSSTSVCLNLAEGYGAYGGSKRNAYRIALREMREAVAALDIARRLGFEVDVDEDRQSKIIGTLVKLANR